MLRAQAMAIVVVGAMVGLARPAQAQAPRTLELKFGPDGLVTLSAQNVTVRDILAEWARQCGCYVVNADRLVGAPLAVPIAFVSAPQPEVLRSLLRETGGYALTPRRADSASVSQYETIYIINPAGPVARSAPPAAAITPIVIRGAPDDEIPPVLPLVIGTDIPASGLPADTQGSQTQPARSPTAAGGFTITPLTPVSSGTVTPAATSTPTQPGKMTPARSQP
jgi:hypothetical protein